MVMKCGQEPPSPACPSQYFKLDSVDTAVAFPSTKSTTRNKQTAGKKTFGRPGFFDPEADEHVPGRKNLGLETFLGRDGCCSMDERRITK